jgi:hypothetical protein
VIKISEKNFISTALHYYDNPQCVTLDEFNEDLSRISRIKKIISMYLNNQQELNERLLLNHLVVLYNVFGNIATDLLLFKVPSQHYKVLFPFLILIDRLPESILSENPVQYDPYVLDKLRQL